MWGAPPNASRGWAHKFGDSHELLGLSFPRRFRHSRQHASHISAATSAAPHPTSGAAAPADTAAGHTSCASAGNATRAAPGDTACTSAACYTACAAAGASAGNTTDAASRATCAAA